jgi:hypothetical protein
MSLLCYNLFAKNVMPMAKDDETARRKGVNWRHEIEAESAED